MHYHVVSYISMLVREREREREREEKEEKTKKE
jgi:hypothetical protein